MASFPAIRDPQADHLLTPRNAALVISDFQPVQLICELQRGWNRTTTAARFAEIVFSVEGR